MIVLCKPAHHYNEFCLVSSVGIKRDDCISLYIFHMIDRRDFGQAFLSSRSCYFFCTKLYFVGTRHYHITMVIPVGSHKIHFGPKITENIF